MTNVIFWGKYGVTSGRVGNDHLHIYRSACVRSIKRMRKRSLIPVALLVVFGAIQLVPVSRTNPAVVTPMKWDSEETKALADRACMDCHSNQTVWPWYSYVAPVSWWIANHVNEGRDKLNFDDLTAVRREGRRKFGNVANAQGEAGEGNEAGESTGTAQGGGARAAKIADDIKEQMQHGQMPMESYLLMHPTARLTEEEKIKLIEGLSKSVAATLGQ